MSKPTSLRKKERKKEEKQKRMNVLATLLVSDPANRFQQGAD